MKKVLTTSVFIFLTGLFAGLFFSYGLSEENISYLVDLLISNLSGSSSGFFRSLGSSLITNLSLAALMIVTVATKKLCPIPFVLLFFKSFTLGFSNSLIHIGQAMGQVENAVFLSLMKMVPQNLLFIPAFILLATASFMHSRESMLKTKRPSHERKDLNKIIIICLAAIVAGCIVEAIVL